MQSSIRVRLLTGYAGMILLLSVAWAAATIGTNVLRASYTHTVDVTDVLTANVVTLEKLRGDEETGLRGYLLTLSPEFLQPYTAARQAIPALRRRTVALAASEPSLHPLLLAIGQRADAWEAWATTAIGNVGAVSAASPQGLAAQREGKALFDRYRAATQRAVASLNTTRQRDLASSLNTLNQMSAIFALIFAAAIGLGLLIGWRAVRAVTRPLARLDRSAAAIGYGDLEHPISLHGDREFVALAQRMEWMRRQLADQRALATLIGSTLRLDEVYAVIAARAKDIISFDRLSIVAVGDDETPRQVYATGLAVEPSGTTSDALTAQLAHAAKSLIRVDLTALPAGKLHAHERPLLEAGLCSGAVVPLHTKGRVTGVLQLWSVRPHAYNPENLAAITALAPLMAAAMENARLHAAVELANASLLEEQHALERTAATLTRYAGELERSNGELEQFAYVASHDLQEPLRMVASYVQLLGRRYRGTLDADADEFIAFAVEGVTRMQTLINDLLAYSRVGTRAKPLLPTPLAGVLAAAQANLAALVAESGATIAIAGSGAGGAGPDGAGAEGGTGGAGGAGAEGGDGALPLVRGDAGQLTQLVQNLLANALKFRRAGVAPVVRVWAERHGAEWHLRVQDNGIGLDVAYAERIFLMFQRLHTREEYAGTGIGLAICKKIAERHGGRLWVESAPGAGATFTLALPALDAADALEATEAADTAA